jgi:fused signal recognition particle receptor
MGLFKKKYDKGLEKTRKSFFSKIKDILKFDKLNDDTLEEIEELLILSDMGIDTVEEVISKLRERCNGKDDPIEVLKEILKEILVISYEDKEKNNKPYVLSIVGVNGTGKTTTIGKLSNKEVKEGKSVVLAACDTFRAAAVDQLKIWSDRTGASIISQGQDADPAAVAFDAVSHAKSKNKDVVIIDTAGRLHTKSNLMEELKKINRVIKKGIPEAPHDTWLVLDSTTGQNGLIQAKKFKETVALTGIILTKLDGTAKGGIAFAIVKELEIPVRYIGLGEGVDDLKEFNAEDFVNALISDDNNL